MNILRASHLGMCFGVRDAITLATTTSQTEPVTILGDLVHNETVLRQLRSQGVQMERQVADVTTATVIITAHGTSEKTLERVHESGKRILEATCPLVHHAHAALRRLVRAGYYPVVIGKKGHVEVRGLTEDLESYDVILEEEEIQGMAYQPRFGVIAQTTQPLERVHRLVKRLQERFQTSEVEFVDTVCQPTKQRQAAAVTLAQQSDIVLVIGGAHSNNTQELVSTCGRHCPRVYHVQEPGDLRATWFRLTDTVGITAGTSTPDRTIEEIEAWLKEFIAFQEKLVEHLKQPASETALGDGAIDLLEANSAAAVLK